MIVKIAEVLIRLASSTVVKKIAKSVFSSKKSDKGMSEKEYLEAGTENRK